MNLIQKGRHAGANWIQNGGHVGINTVQKETECRDLAALNRVTMKENSFLPTRMQELRLLMFIFLDRPMTLHDTPFCTVPKVIPPDREVAKLSSL
jgi:hypothetical protein